MEHVMTTLITLGARLFDTVVVATIFLAFS
jgi:hypothetical protein